MFSKLILTIILGLALTSASYAYNPPIGIPAPSFGIDEIAPGAPTEWPSAQASSHFYVDNTHANATDINNPNGYPDKPRLTIPTATFPAGSYVELRGGPYTNNMDFTFQCTQQAPCWLRGSSQTDMPTISGSIGIRDSSYLIMENLDFNGGSRGAAGFGSSGDHLAFRNSFIRNRTMVAKPSTSAFGITPALGKTITDVVVYNNNFHDLGDWTRLDDLDFIGIGPNTWNRDSTTELKNVWLLENDFQRVSSSGIIVNGGNWVGSHNALHHIYIGKNTGQNNRQSLIGIKQASDIIISENVAHNSRTVGLQPGDGITLQYNPRNLWIIYNHIYDSNYGIRQSDTSPTDDGDVHDFYIVGNLIHDIYPENLTEYNPTNAWRQGQAISLWHGNMSRYIVDNTIYDVQGGITAIFSGPIHMSGNLIYDIDPQDYYVHISHPAKNGIASIDHSLLDDTNGDFRIFWNWQTYTDLASFQAATGQCTSCIKGDPLFVNPTQGEQLQNPHDFSLGSASPALGANNNLNNVNNTPDVYARFQQLYGIDIRRDLRGVSRPVAGRSIGAYEVSSGIPAPVNPVPPAPVPVDPVPVDPVPVDPVPVDPVPVDPVPVDPVPVDPVPVDPVPVDPVPVDPVPVDPVPVDPVPVLGCGTDELVDELLKVYGNKYFTKIFDELHALYLIKPGQSLESCGRPPAATFLLELYNDERFTSAVKATIKLYWAI